MIWGLGFSGWGVGFRVSSSGCRVHGGSGLRVSGSGCGVSDVGFGVDGVEVQHLGCQGPGGKTQDLVIVWEPITLHHSSVQGSGLAISAGGGCHLSACGLNRHRV